MAAPLAHTVFYTYPEPSDQPSIWHCSIGASGTCPVVRGGNATTFCWIAHEHPDATGHPQELIHFVCFTCFMRYERSRSQDQDLACPECRLAIRLPAEEERSRLAIIGEDLITRIETPQQAEERERREPTSLRGRVAPVAPPQQSQSSWGQVAACVACFVLGLFVGLYYYAPIMNFSLALFPNLV